MKKIRLSKGIDRKTKTAAILGAGIILLALLVSFWKAVNSWYDSHYFQFNQPVKITLAKPVEIKERKLETTQIVEIVEQIPTLDNLQPIEQYICEKWGVYDCKTALAIARAESGMREDAININTNNTIDVGIYQINSVHFKKDGCNLKDLVDQYKNVDCAYQIYEAQGWSPWVAFKTGSFAGHLEE